MVAPGNGPAGEGTWPVYDIVIVGGGPAGLFGAFYAGIRKMSCEIIDSMPELGGQIAALYPEKYIYDVAGFPRVLGGELVERLKEQALYDHPTVTLSEQVRRLEREAEGLWRLETDKGSVRLARSVLIASGVGSFRPRRLSLPDLERWEENGIYYGVPNLAMFTDKAVLVVGGGDSAFDWALMLNDVTDRVTLIHRSDRFRALDESVERLRRSTATVLPFFELRAVEGDERIRAARIVDNRTGEERRIEVDAVIVSIGFQTSLGPIGEWGLELEGDQIRVNSQMETNLPGVYAAGDVAAYPGKVKLIATGFGEAATAVNAAKKRIDPGARQQPVHSSELKR